MASQGHRAGFHATDDSRGDGDVTSRAGDLFRQLVRPLSERRVRSKLLLIILIPLIAVAILASMRVVDLIGEARAAGRAEQMAALAQRVTALTQELQQERDLTAGFLGSNKQSFREDLVRKREDVDLFVDRYRTTAAEFDESFGRVTADRLATVDKQLGQLGALRESVDNEQRPADTVTAEYTSAIGDLITVLEGVDTGIQDTELTEDARALVALARAKELVSQERALLMEVLGRGSFNEGQATDLVALRARREATVNQFESIATPDQRDAYVAKLDEIAVGESERIEDSVLALAGGPLGVQADDWYVVMSRRIGLMRDVENGFARAVEARADALQTSTQWQLGVEGALLLLVLGLTIGASLYVARSMAQPLSALRTNALDVANKRLPDTVRRFREEEDPDVSLDTGPIAVTSKDEIGEVSEAFNAVHHQALRLASEEALLRRNVGSVFTNLSRRTQSLVERQLRLIDELESKEQDPDALAQLFRLDHLATRMRRNAENLLVLAGSEPGRRLTRPVELIDVLRAAAAEVEQYTRIVHTSVARRAVVGTAAGDLVHLVAELLDNATGFSSPDTTVTVRADAQPDGGAIVEIADQGVGMSESDLAAANARLATAHGIDITLTRRMGLFVVARLAGRHGITVRLEAGEQRGTVAVIELPAHIVVAAGGAVGSTGTLPSARTPDISGPLGVIGGRASAASLPSADTRSDSPRSLPAGAGAGPRAGLSSSPPASSFSGERTTAGLPQRDGASNQGPVPNGNGASAPADQGQSTAGAGAQRGPSRPARGGPPQGAFGPPSDLPGPTDTGSLFVPRSQPGDSNGRSYERDTGWTDPANGRPYVGAGAGSGDGDNGVGREPVRDTGAVRDALDERVPIPADDSPPPIFAEVESEWFRRPTGKDRAKQAGPPSSRSGPAGKGPSGRKKAGAARPDGARTDSARTDSARTDGGRTDGARTDSAAPTDSTARTGPAVNEDLTVAAKSRSAFDEAVARNEERLIATGENRAIGDEPQWRSPGDEGWEAAARTEHQEPESVTRAGLPQRVPMANFVPGAAPERTASRPTGRSRSAARPDSGAPQRSAEQVRGFLSSYQRGVSQGRHASSGPKSAQSGDDQASTENSQERDDA